MIPSSIADLSRALRHMGAALTLGCAAAPVFAAGMQVGVEVPRLDVAEYHRPYMAVWIEREDSTVAATLNVWYDMRIRNGEGTKWLKDLRQWWRRAGRELDMPVDGVSAPTRPVGVHTLNFTAGTHPLPELQPGSYRLMVEAAREVGGRELLGIPFTWPVQAVTQLSAKGKTEIGTVTLEITP